jgi:hypothetical protein
VVTPVALVTGGLSMVEVMENLLLLDPAHHVVRHR